jgi:PsbP-like protein
MRMRLRRSPWSSTLLGCVVVLMAFLAWGCSGDGGSAGGEDKIYTDPDFGFSFEYPADWQLQEGDSSDVTAGGSASTSVGVFDPEGAVADDTFIDLVQISVYELNVTVDESVMPEIQGEVEQVIASLESQAADIQTLDPLSETKVGDMRGFEVTYSFSKGSAPVTSTLYFLFDGNLEYQFTAQSSTENWEENVPVFDALISSFQPGTTE